MQSMEQQRSGWKAKVASLLAQSEGSEVEPEHERQAEELARTYYDNAPGELSPEWTVNEYLSE